MNPEDIARGYDSLASFWHGNQFSRDNGIHQHQRALQSVEGLDLSTQMLELARQRRFYLQYGRTA